MRGSIAVLTVQLNLPGCNSLKQKRSILKRLINQLQREFNLSVAELDRLDDRDSAVIACASLSNDPTHSRQVLQNAIRFIQDKFRDLEIIEDQIIFV